MDSLMAVTDYVEPWRTGPSDFEPVSFKWIPSLNRSSSAFDQFSLDAETNPNAKRWDPATVWNKTFQVLKGSKTSTFLPNSKKSEMCALVTTSPGLLANQEVAGVHASPKDVMSVLLTDESRSSSKENSSTLFGASCSRRSITAKRSYSGLLPTASIVPDNTCSPNNNASSGIAASNSSNRSHNTKMSKAGSFLSFSVLEKACSKSASTSQARQSHRSLTFASPFARWGDSIPLSATVDLDLDAGLGSRGTDLEGVETQTPAANSVSMIRKAISAPLEKAGVLNKGKEKQE